MKKTIWNLDTYDEGKEGSIVELMQDDIKSRGSQAIFNKEFWIWKYKKNNAGFYPKWIKLAKSNDSDFIGGHYTVIPVYLKNKDKRILSGQSVDTLTHTTFRKQGVFTQLADFCYDELINDGVDLIYGYPNDNSFPGFVKKLNWKHLFTVYELGYILNISNLVNSKFKKGIKNIIAKIGLHLIYKVHQSINVFFINKDISYKKIKIREINNQIVDKLISTEHKFYIDRSSDYFKWRYSNNPVDKEIYVKEIIYENETVGYYIIKFKTYPHRDNIKIAHIMELIIKKDIKNIYSSVLNDIIHISKKEKATLIYTYSHDKQFDYKQYKKNGFIKLDNKNFIVRVNKNKEKLEGVYEANNWFISQGDSDRA